VHENTLPLFTHNGRVVKSGYLLNQKTDLSTKLKKNMIICIIARDSEAAGCNLVLLLREKFESISPLS